MENINQEQVLAAGLIGFAIIGVAVLVSFLLMAGTLKLSIAWMGNASPSFLACLGWLFGITFVNSFIVFGTLAVAGEKAVLLVTPLTWFVTLYMVSTAANCGLIRAFGIWIVNSILSSIGLVAIVFVMMIPLAIIGAGAQAGGDELQAEFEKVDAMMAEMDEEMEALEQLDAIEIPETTEVRFQTGSESPQAGAAQPGGDFPTFEETAPGRESSNQPPQAVKEPKPSQPDRSSRSRSTTTRPAPKKRTKAPSRAADGSTINPFFQN